MDAMMTIAKLGASFIVVTLAIFAIGLAVESVAPAQRRQPAKGTRLNIAYAVFHAFVRSAAAALLAGAPVLGIGALGGGLIALPREGWAVVFSAIVYIVVIDLAEYLFHRAQHAWPALWALHSLHHSDRAVNVTTSTRHHWVDVFIRSIVIYPIVGLLFAVPYQAVLANALVGYYNYFLHFNIRISFGPLWAVLNSPQYHRVHHSDAARHQNKNFAALFPVFDVLFGTSCRASAGEYPKTGIKGRQGPSRIWEAVAWPFGASATDPGRVHRAADAA
jgi:sterol desaturase/sphingolipid hydroxylase (fatty acid hydroxylase superfamily)